MICLWSKHILLCFCLVGKNRDKSFGQVILLGFGQSGFLESCGDRKLMHVTNDTYAREQGKNTMVWWINNLFYPWNQPVTVQYTSKM